jgi:hypothetical protein
MASSSRLPTLGFLYEDGGLFGLLIFSIITDFVGYLHQLPRVYTYSPVNIHFV